MFALIVSGAGCASTNTMPAASPARELRPHAVGWERFFDIDWRPAERKGRPIVSSTVHSRYGATASRVQLLVQARDDNGHAGASPRRPHWTLKCGASSLSKVRALSREGTVHSTSRAIPNRRPSAVDQTLRPQQGAFEHNVP